MLGLVFMWKSRLNKMTVTCSEFLFWNDRPRICILIRYHVRLHGDSETKEQEWIEVEVKRQYNMIFHVLKNLPCV